MPSGTSRGDGSRSLVRDRLGVKPLVYRDTGGTIAFASTISALEAGGFAGEIDPEAILEFLDSGSVTEERSVFKGLRKLSTGDDPRMAGRQSFREMLLDPARGR